jgi:hypothetical protein
LTIFIIHETPLPLLEKFFFAVFSYCV